jgi:hypothetical protein
MNLEVKRKVFTEKSVIGDLLVNGEPAGVTLEPPKRDEKPCAIPVGTYDVHIRFSPKHNRMLPHVDDVPGFSEIEIHIGNFPQDTEGCLLVGTEVGPLPDEILHSTAEFQPLFDRMQTAMAEAEPITISYSESA